MARNILIADDDRTIAHLIKEIIERRGATALVAYDGEQAFKIFNNFKVDLIITDLKMPNVDGMSLIRMIRESNTDIPIIIITGYGSDRNYALAQNYGVTNFLSKPCSVIDISRAIDSALDLSKST
ncbi:MAG: response regulator [Spirochaetes bacterium]|nr:response regulator [Spirochaetota bacterium]